jgi:hypothetical protein
MVTFTCIHTMYSVCFTPFIILPLPLSPFIKWLWQVSLFHIHRCIDNHWPYSPSFTLIISLPLPLVPSPYHELFYIPVLYCLSACTLFSGSFLSIFPVNILCFNQSNPLYYSSLSFSPYLIIILWRKHSLFIKWCWGSQISACIRLEIDPCLSSCTNINSK